MSYLVSSPLVNPPKTLQEPLLALLGQYFVKSSPGWPQLRHRLHTLFSPCSPMSQSQHQDFSLDPLPQQNLDPESHSCNMTASLGVSTSCDWPRRKAMLPLPRPDDMPSSEGVLWGILLVRAGWPSIWTQYVLKLITA